MKEKKIKTKLGKIGEKVLLILGLAHINLPLCYGPFPAPLLSVIEPGIFLHDLTFGLCFGLEGCEDNFDMLLFYLYAIELEERKNVRNICHVYP